jgi:hypothetical protein
LYYRRAPAAPTPSSSGPATTLGGKNIPNVDSAAIFVGDLAQDVNDAQLLVSIILTLEYVSYQNLLSY